MVDFGNSRHDREAQPRTPGVRMIGASEPLAQFRKGGSRQAGPLVPDEDTGTRANRDNNRSASGRHAQGVRSEEHTSELQSLMRISYAVFCLKKKKQQ